MRTLALLFASGVGVLAEGVQWPELRGIVHVDGMDKPAAVLVMTKSRTPVTYSTILPVNGTDPGLDSGHIQVARIDAPKGLVELRHLTSSDTTVLKLTGLPEPTQYLIHLERSPIRPAVDCYQRLSGRTVIYSAQLPVGEVDIHIPADQEKTGALAALARAIAMQEALIISRGEKFAFAVPPPQKPLVASLPTTPATDGAPPGMTIPPGLIRFIDADVLQVIAFYQDLSGRTVLRPTDFPNGRVTVRTQTSMNVEEAKWMVEAALRLCGLATVPAGDKFVFVVPPKRAAALPQFDPAIQVPGKPGLINFVEVSCAQLLEVYAALHGRKALPVEGNLPKVRFTLRSRGPLSPAEASFALEAIAALNNLAFRPTDDNGVKLVPRATVPDL
jgi:hypothetical protein